MFTAAGFVGFLSADHYDGVIVAGRFAINEALGTAGILATDDADGM
jgi:hypothetical protein